MMRTDVVDAVWKCNYCCVHQHRRGQKKKASWHQTPRVPCREARLFLLEYDLHTIIYCQGSKSLISSTGRMFNLVISNVAYNFHLRPFPCFNIWAPQTCWFKKLETKGEFFCPVCWSGSLSAQEHLCLSFSFQKQKDGQCSGNPSHPIMLIMINVMIKSITQEF